MLICSFVGQIARDAALGARRQEISKADVGERPSHHDFVVAAAAAVAVEVTWRDAVVLQVLRGGAVERDRAGWRNVVGRDRIAEQAEHTCAFDVRGRRRLTGFDTLEERRKADVGRLGVPTVAICLLEAHLAPLRRAIEHDRIALDELLLLDRRPKRLR